LLSLHGTHCGGKLMYPVNVIFSVREKVGKGRIYGKAHPSNKVPFQYLCVWSDVYHLRWEYIAKASIQPRSWFSSLSLRIAPARS
jgi:hypothetical protein